MYIICMYMYVYIYIYIYVYNIYIYIICSYTLVRNGFFNMLRGALEKMTKSCLDLLVYTHSMYLIYKFNII